VSFNASKNETPIYSLNSVLPIWRNSMAKATTAEATLNDNDPLSSISQAMRDAMDSASEDASKAREKIGEIGSGITNTASRFAYTSSYMVAYGVVYATVFVARSIPQDNPIVEGFKDGSRAAIDALNEARANSSEVE
jgi:hypothetical protein